MWLNDMYFIINYCSDFLKLIVNSLQRIFGRILKN